MVQSELRLPHGGSEEGSEWLKRESGDDHSGGMQPLGATSGLSCHGGQASDWSHDAALEARSA